MPDEPDHRVSDRAAAARHRPRALLATATLTAMGVAALLFSSCQSTENPTAISQPETVQAATAEPTTPPSDTAETEATTSPADHDDASQNSGDTTNDASQSSGDTTPTATATPAVQRPAPATEWVPECYRNGDAGLVLDFRAGLDEMRGALRAGDGTLSEIRGQALGETLVITSQQLGSPIGIEQTWEWFGDDLRIDGATHTRVDCASLQSLPALAEIIELPAELVSQVARSFPEGTWCFASDGAALTMIPSITDDTIIGGLHPADGTVFAFAGRTLGESLTVNVQQVPGGAVSEQAWAWPSAGLLIQGDTFDRVDCEIIASSAEPLDAITAYPNFPPPVG